MNCNNKSTMELDKNCCEKVFDKVLKRGGSNGYIILPKYTSDEERIRANEAVKKACAEIIMNRADEGLYL